MIETKAQRMTSAQRAKIVDLSQRRDVPCAWDDWMLNPVDLPDGWVAGWVGGYDNVNKTIYIGIDPDGRGHS